MLPHVEENYKTVKTKKSKVLSLYILSPQIPENPFIREPHSINLTKYLKSQLKECKVEQLQEQDRTAELVSKFSFSL